MIHQQEFFIQMHNNHALASYLIWKIQKPLDAQILTNKLYMDLDKLKDESVRIILE
jgi:hypothetical protein